MTSLLPRRYLPVLMYHRVGDARGGDPLAWVSRERFSLHLRWIRERGLRTLSLDEAYDALARGGRRPRDGVLITFDDGYEEALTVAGPCLADAGMQAALFVAPRLLGGPAARAGNGPGRILDAAGLREWVSMGNDVGSHTLTHADLTATPLEAMRDELRGSRTELEEMLRRPILDFCYPLARHDATARAEVARAGYRSGYAGEPPLYDIHAIPRMMVYLGDTERRFRRKLSGHYYWLSAWHRLLTRRPRDPHRRAGRPRRRP